MYEYKLRLRCQNMDMNPHEPGRYDELIKGANAFNNMAHARNGKNIKKVEVVNGDIVLTISSEKEMKNAKQCMQSFSQCMVNVGWLKSKNGKMFLMHMDQL